MNHTDAMMVVQHRGYPIKPKAIKAVFFNPPCQIW